MTEHSMKILLIDKFCKQRGNIWAGGLPFPLEKIMSCWFQYHSNILVCIYVYLHTVFSTMYSNDTCKISVSMTYVFMTLITDPSFITILNTLEYYTCTQNITVTSVVVVVVYICRCFTQYLCIS